MGTIDLIQYPRGGEPSTTDDYNKQNALIQQLLFQYNLKTLFVTRFNTFLKPKIAQGVSIHHGGAQFVVNTSDYDISGTPSDGRVYIKLTRVGDQLQASFINSASGFSWNYIYCGFYNIGGDQLLPYIIIVTNSGVNWFKYTLDNSQNKYDIEAKIKVDLNISLGGWDIPAGRTRDYSLPSQFLAVYNPLTTTAMTNYITDVKIQINDDDENLVYDTTMSGDDGAIGMTYTLRRATTDIRLIANLGEWFDTTSFNDDTISRGNIHLECLL